jgi:NAD(P)-dependent dehydrogenase (short-subunit alcohol dehydrogenase family)
MGILTGKGAVITGAASGIGRAAALKFANAGAALLLADIDGDGGEAAAAEIRRSGGVAQFFAADVAQPESVASLFATAEGWLPSLDIVVHAAGILRGAFVPIDELDLEVWNQVISVNLTGTFLCARYALPGLTASRGCFLGLASGAGVRGGSSSLAYGASKGGVNGLMMTLAPQFAARGVRARVLCPGGIDTPMKRQNLADAARAGQAPASAPDLGDPDGIAWLLLYLATDEGGFLENPIFTR